MQFTSIPDNYALLDGGLLYEIDLGGLRDSVDIAIVDTTRNNTLATLRFAQTSAVSLDIAPYVRRAFAPAPAAGPTGISYNTRCTAAIVLRTDQGQSPERVFSLYAIDGLPRLLTAMPDIRTIAAGEFDLIPFYAPQGGKITINPRGTGMIAGRIISVAANKAPGVLRIAADDFAGAVALSVKFESEGRTDIISYDVVRRPSDAVRVAWVSSTGAVESYTFPTCKTRTLKADKARFYGRTGYKTTSIGGEASLLLLSDFEPHAAVEALDEILTSPQVWFVREGRITEADVVSSETVYRHGGALNSLALEIRTCKREEGLR